MVSSGASGVVFGASVVSSGALGVVIGASVVSSPSP